MREQYVEAVLAVAALIPPARVLSYGDIAALLESGGPRQVGAVMSAHGGSVPWWRVVRSSGAAPKCHEGAALQHYRQEHTPLRAGASAGKNAWRLDMAKAAWCPAEADLIHIEALAARLRDADDADRPAPATGASNTISGTTMSVPCDGLRA